MLEDFLDIAVEECESILQGWRQSWSHEGDSEVDRANADVVLDKAFALFREAEDRRYLLNLRAEAEHDWGWVLGDFHEFVLVVSDGTIHVLVAFDDLRQVSSPVTWWDTPPIDSAVTTALSAPGAGLLASTRFGRVFLSPRWTSRAP